MQWLRLPRSAILHFPVALVVVLFIFLPSTVVADWTQWRGAHGDGSVSGPARSRPLPGKLPVVWERQVGGGYSGPVISGDHVWVHSRQGTNEVVTCLHLETGAPIWRQSYPVPFVQDDDALQHGLGPFATPALQDGHLLTFGITSVLIAWDAASGELLWRRDSADEFDPAFPFFGAANSPVVWEDRVFVHLGGHARRHIEDPSEGALVALRISDGGEIWRWIGDGPAVGATAALVEVEGRPHLVLKTKKLLVGVDPRTGRELWRLPYVVSQDNTIVTPLFAGGRLFTSDYDRGIEAWTIEPDGETWTIRELWTQRDASLSMSSPVVAGGSVVGFSHMRKGQLVVLDPENGEVTWQGPGRSGEHASLVSWADEVMVFTDDGSMTIGRVESHRFHRLGRHRLGEAVAWAHPAVVEPYLVYRDGDDLVVRRLHQD